MFRSKKQSSSPDQDGERFPRAQSYYVFGLLFLLYMFDYIDRLVIVSLFPYLKLDWGVTDAQCGLLVSAVYWSILLFTFPASILVDRWSRRKSIGIMSLLWSIATIASAVTRNFGQLFVARAAVGLGEAGYCPGGTAMISAMFPQQWRSRMLGVWNSSIPLGSALGIVLGGVVAERYGWRHVFGLVAVPGAAIAILFFFVPDYQTIALSQPGDADGAEPAKPVLYREIAAGFVRNKTLILNNLAFAANTFVTTSLITWLPTFYHRTEGLPMDRASTKGGLVMLLAIVGAPLGGYLTDRWQATRAEARMLFPCVSSLVTAGLLFVAFGLLEGQTQYVVLLITGATAVAFVPAALSVTQDVVHPGLRAVSASLCVIVQHLLGSALGPPVVGAISDRYSLDSALQTLFIGALVAGVLFFIGARYYASDCARVDRVDVVLEGAD